MNKQQLKDLIKPILEKGKLINDIIFVSQKMAYFDICFMLKLCRPVDSEYKTPKFFSFRWGEPKSAQGWESKDLYNMVENHVLTGGKDGLEQLLFGCIAALDVYTEDEILTILDAQLKYGELKNEK